VELADGAHVKFDEDYIRESILNPSAKVVKGYQPIMPTFQGLVTEENVLQLIEYIKSLTPKEARPPGRRSGSHVRGRKSTKQ
jgi:cytochrome c oxidase subunit 2